MQKSNQNSKSNLVTIILALVAVIAIGVAVWALFFKEDTKQQDETNTTTAEQKTESEDTEPAKDETTQPVAPVAEYVDYRIDKKDTTGVVLKTKDDVAKINKAGEKIKQYTTENVGKTVSTPVGTNTLEYTIDRVYGEFAAGTSTGVPSYVIWGLKDGKVDVVAGTQNLGFACKDLKAAKVPAELVDGRCFDFDGGNGQPLEYKTPE